jgi:hypothetical protein
LKIKVRSYHSSTQNSPLLSIYTLLFFLFHVYPYLTDYVLYSFILLIDCYIWI